MKIKGWKGWLALLGIVTVTLVIGAAMGGASDTKPTTAAKPKVVTHTVTKTVTVTVPVEVTKEVTPQACLDALDTAESVFGTAGEGFTLASSSMGAISDAMSAIETYDVDTITAATATISANNDRMDGLTAEVSQERDTFDSEASDCRAG